jgi:DNA-binding response OmpR family regulator
LRRVLAVTLQRAGCQVALAHSAYEALLVLRQHTCDALVLDMDSASGESWRVLHALNVAHFPPPVVALLSLNSGEQTELEAFGVHVILRKPVGRDALLKGVTVALRSTGKTPLPPL